jgi:RsiW-degrading membrane proteinase PrsW (M82 family)
MIFSVGLCEELVKLLPVLCLILTNKLQSLRSVLYIGAISGLGFGIAEGVHYSFNVYLPGEAPLSVYLMRFFGVAFSHAIWTVVAATVLFLAKDDVRITLKQLSFNTRRNFNVNFLLLLFVIVMASAIPHSLYDSFCVHGAKWLAYITDALMVLGASWIMAAETEISKG